MAATCRVACCGSLPRPARWGAANSARRGTHGPYFNLHRPGTLPTSSFASNVITSVGLSDNANQTGQAPTVQRFTVGQTIWLSSVINVGKMSGSGILTVKWYENDLLYATSTRDFHAPKEQAVATAVKAIPVRARQVYTQPGDAKVEVYWNGQLVTTLHFVVEPKAQQ